MFLNHEDDAIGAASDAHKIIFENESVRVLDVVAPVGYKSTSHWHPKNMGFVLVGGKLRFILPDGVIKDVELSKDQVTQSAGSHIVENIGDNEVRVLQIEFKHE